MLFIIYRIIAIIIAIIYLLSLLNIEDRRDLINISIICVPIFLRALMIK